MENKNLTVEEVAEKIGLRSEYNDNPSSYLKGVKVTLKGFGYDDIFADGVIESLRDKDINYGYKAYNYKPIEDIIMENTLLTFELVGEKRENLHHHHGPEFTVVTVEVQPTGQIAILNTDDTNITDLLLPSEKEMFRELCKGFAIEDEKLNQENVLSFF